MVLVASIAKKALAALALAIYAEGFVIPEGNNKRDGAGYISLDFDVIRKPVHVNATKIGENSQEKRYIPLPLDNQGPSYAVNITLGSNKQPITVTIDTGSSDLWVVDANAVCENQSDCKDSGTFNPKTSKTFQSLGKSFEIEYGDHTTSKGTWAKDTVGLGGASITAQQFADVNTTSVAGGILGISVPGSETQNLNYDNVPITLKKQGIIKTNAYSLFLNEPEASSGQISTGDQNYGAGSTGQIIFGGVDHAKYHGALIEEKIVPTTPQRLAITLNEFSYNGLNFTVNEPAVLDSGSTVSYLPREIVEAIAEKVNAAEFTTPDGGSEYVIPCDFDATGNATFSFQNGAAIGVPLNSFGFGQGFCILGVQPMVEGLGISAVLGDNFLRYAYVLYNLDANTISLAPVNFTDKSDIEAI
ncbi:uncharacterized protein LODBEIA_P23130 [Lodderomyces beijingensis]|uniref:candidapepsin n=1 Tax=Lodderomyces beijingensis TaxID=1775926 RepID=A0ABP0ZJP1_9ASCO